MSTINIHTVFSRQIVYTCMEILIWRGKKSAVSNSKGSLRERAYAHVQRKIASGELPPDSPVSEQILAQELGMSRTPIREAIGQLTAEGLLEQTPNRGTLVVQFKRQDIIDLYELREALEVYSVSKVARSSIRPVDLKRWQDIVDEILILKKELDQSGKPALDAAQMHRFVTSDLTFHALLMSLAVNHRMLKVVNDTRLLIRIFSINRPGYDAPKLEEIHHQHNAIIQAVSKHNPEIATQLLTGHIRISLEERLAAYDAWEHEASLQKSIPNFFGLTGNFD